MIRRGEDGGLIYCRAMPADGPLVHLERRDDGVAVVRLDNLGALSTEVLRQSRPSPAS